MSATPHARGPTAAEVDVEQAVIALLLEGADTAWRVLDVVSHDDFLEPLHQRIFAASRRVLDAGGEVTPLTLGAALSSDAGLNEVGGPDYFRRMRQLWPRNSDIAADLCQALSANTLRRNLASLIASTESEILNPEAATDEIISSHAEAIQALVEGRTASDEPRSWYDAGKAVIDTVEARSAGLASQTLLPFGISPIDARLGGADRGELVILAGRPGMGKTAAGLFIAHAVARRGTGVYFASLEMRDEALLQRGLSMRARERGTKIPYDVIRRGKMHDFQQDELANALLEDASLPLVIDQRRGVTVAQIGTRIRRAQARFRREGRPLGLGVIDHIGLIESSGQYRGNRVAEVTDITKSLKNLAGSLGIPLLCLCQLNRQVESRDDKRPMLADLRDSGSIEQDADIVIFAHREEYYLRKNPPKADAKEMERGKWQVALSNAENKLDLIIAKNRNGAEGQVTVNCEIAYNWIGGEA